MWRVTLWRTVLAPWSTAPSTAPTPSRYPIYCTSALQVGYAARCHSLDTPTCKLKHTLLSRMRLQCCSDIWSMLCGARFNVNDSCGSGVLIQPLIASAARETMLQCTSCFLLQYPQAIRLLLAHGLFLRCNAATCTYMRCYIVHAGWWAYMFCTEVRLLFLSPDPSHYLCYVYAGPCCGATQ